MALVEKWYDPHWKLETHPMHSYTTDAIILKRFNLGEADRVLTLLTRDRGRVSAIGRGIRRTKSRLGGHLELFSHSQLGLSEGRTFDTITSADLVEPHTGLSTFIERVNAAHYVAEAVLKLTVDEQIVDRLFELVAATFAQLAKTSETAALLAGFQLKLLALLGHQPTLDRCVHCREKFQGSEPAPLVIPDWNSDPVSEAQVPESSNTWILDPDSRSVIGIRSRMTDKDKGIARVVAGFDSVHGGLVCRECLATLHHPIVSCDQAGQACLRRLLLEPLGEARSTAAGFRTAGRVIEQALLTQTERPLKSRAFVELVPVIPLVSSRT